MDPFEAEEIVQSREEEEQTLLENPWSRIDLSWWSLEYLTDWITAIVILLASIWAKWYMIPFEQEIDPNDKSIQYPHEKAIVSGVQSWELAVFFPVVIVILMHLIDMLVHPRQRQRDAGRILKDLHHACLAILLSLALTSLSEQLFCHWFGQLRPDFLDRCGWDSYLGKCTADKEKINRGRCSFPSGHSARTASGMFFVTWYLWGKYKIWNKRGCPGKAVLLFLSYIPMLVVVYAASTRVVQHSHSPIDVLAGTLLGATISYISYNLFFPLD